jgi:hypothetical protein
MRRAVFFLIAAIACYAMILVIDAELAYVPKIVGTTYAVLALLATLDTVGRNGGR